jgi:hypothetical protein
MTSPRIHIRNQPDDTPVASRITWNPAATDVRATMNRYRAYLADWDAAIAEDRERVLPNRIILNFNRREK